MRGLALVCALLLAELFLLRGCYSQNCQIPGWFGTNCSLKCQCERFPNCHPATGECAPGDSCKIGYFGPACQYMDLGVMHTMQESSTAYAVDSDDKTCNRKPNVTLVRVYFTDTLWTDWLRLVFNYPVSDSFMKFHTEYFRCAQQRRYIVDNVTVDVTCDYAVRLMDLFVEGPMVAHLCSIYISGGRNIALKSDAFRDLMPHKIKSSIIVDGIKEYSPGNHSCSTYTFTPGTITYLVWTINFKRPHKLYMFKIYNSDPPTLKYFDYLTVNVHGYTDEHTLPGECRQRPLPVVPCTFPESAPRMIMMLEISGKLDVRSCPQNVAPTDLCEIEVYGDSDCTVGKFGRECEQTCSCDANLQCHHVTGRCSTRCPAGRFGPDCIYLCSDNCYKEMCDEETGACSQCPAGLKGDDCSVRCTPGTYGSGCVYNCSATCVGPCNITTGVCSECVAGFYGRVCAEQCAEGCLQRICRKDKGECEACITGFVGPYCSECYPGTYGSSCERNCTASCLNKCYKMTGWCVECVRGLYGKNCTRQCSNSCLNQICERDTGWCKSCNPGRLGRRCDNRLSTSKWKVSSRGCLWRSSPACCSCL
ncbi:hypothetical protein BsWGS_28225 [Bradybaena similaris]